MTSDARRPLVELTIARLKEFIREPSAVFWTFGFPLLLTVALGIAFRAKGEDQLDVAVVAGAGADELAHTLDAHPRLAAQVREPAVAARRLRTGASLVVVDIGGAAGGDVAYRFDPARPGANEARQLVDDAIQRAAGRTDARVARDDTVAVPGGRYIDWLVPGLLGMQLMSGSIWGIGFVIVQGRQRKLLKRLVATPMRRADYLLAFMLCRLVFVLVETAVLLGFARVTFGVALQGSLISVVLLALVGAGSFAGLALLCASRARNTETVSGLMNLVMLPMFVLSGVFFSASHFPSAIMPLVNALPLTALNDALRAVINDGASLAAQTGKLAILGVWGLVSFVAALRIFRWT